MFFILFYIIFFTFILSFVVKFDSDVFILIDNYEIFTNTSFIFLFIFTVFLLGFTFNHIMNSFFNIRTNINLKFIKNSYKKYLDNVYHVLLNYVSGNINKSNKYLVRARRNVNDKFSDLLDSLLNRNYKVNDFNFNYYVDLNNAIFTKDNAKIKEISKKILNINKKDLYCQYLLYNVSKEDGNWQECLEIIKNKKIKKDDLLVVYKNLAIQNYNDNNFDESFKYSNLYFKYDKSNVENNKILIKSITKEKLLKKYIEKIWKFTPYDELVDIYCKGDYKVLKKLYKINPDNNYLNRCYLKNIY